MKIERVALDAIQVRPGRRPADPATVERLAESIGARGLLQPAGVTTDYVLIWGLHRIEAHRKLGLTEIECHVLDCDDRDRQLMEIDENLAKVDLAPARRIKDTARRKELYEAKYPETKHGAGLGVDVGRGRENRSPQTGDSCSRPPAFAEDTTKKTGRSRGVIERDARIGAAFAEDEIEKMAEARLPILVMDLLVGLKKREPAVVNEMLATPLAEMRGTMEDKLKELGYEFTEGGHWREPGAKTKTGGKTKGKAKSKTPKTLTLEQFEAIIEGKLEAFQDAAKALFQIREQHLYTERHGQFHHYLKERWGVGYHWGRPIAAALDAFGHGPERENLDDR